MAATNPTAMMALSRASGVGGVQGGANTTALRNQLAKQPTVPTLPPAPNAQQEQAAAESAASQAKTAQRRRSQQAAGRQATLLTNAATLGQAPVQRATLLGL